MESGVQDIGSVYRQNFWVYFSKSRFSERQEGYPVNSILNELSFKDFKFQRLPAARS